MASCNNPLTPLKIKRKLCVCCGKEPSKGHTVILHSDTSIKKQLPLLLEKYGGVKYVDGIMCTGCEQKIKTFDKKINEFSAMCRQTAIYNSKRLPISPCVLHTPPHMKENRPINPKRTNVKSCMSLKFSQASKDDSGLEDIFPMEDISPIKLSPKGKQALDTIDHGYAQNLEKKKDKARDHPVKVKGRPSAFAICPDHDYVASLKKKDVVFSAKLANTGLKANILKYMKFIEGDIPQLTVTEWLEIEASVQQQQIGEFLDKIMEIKPLWQHVIHFAMRRTQQTVKYMGNRKHGFVSYLFHKDYEDLATFDWITVLNEAFTKLPDLMQIALAVCLQQDSLDSVDAVERVIPKLGLLYAVLVQSAKPELSKVQRILSLVLHDNICDQKVDLNLILW